MARSYGNIKAQNDPEQNEEFAFRKGIKRRYRDQLEGMVSGEPYNRAKQAATDETRRQGAELLAASNTRNIGAIGGQAQNMAKQAAYQMAMLEMDKSEGALRGLEGLQQMDTAQSEQNKKRREYEMAIRDFARKSGKLGMGIFGEQEETADYVEALAASETDQELKDFLTEKAFALRGGGKSAEGKAVAKWDV